MRGYIKFKGLTGLIGSVIAFLLSLVLIIGEIITNTSQAVIYGFIGLPLSIIGYFISLFFFRYKGIDK